MNNLLRKMNYWWIMAFPNHNIRKISICTICFDIVLAIYTAICHNDHIGFITYLIGCSLIVLGVMLLCYAISRWNDTEQLFLEKLESISDIITGIFTLIASIAIACLLSSVLLLVALKANDIAVTIFYAAIAVVLFEIWLLAAAFILSDMSKDD